MIGDKHLALAREAANPEADLVAGAAAEALVKGLAELALAHLFEIREHRLKRRRDGGA